MKTDPKAIGARIKAILDKKGMTQRAFSEKIGVSDPTVSAYVRGQAGVPAEVYVLVSEMGGVSIDWLITGKELAGYVAEPANEYTAATLPVRGLAGAGDPCCIDQLEPIGQITVSKDYNGPNIQVIQIRGNSMEPTYMDGAHVGVDIAAKEVISGQAYAVYIPHEGIVVKRIWIGPELVKIASDNPAAPSHEVMADRVNWDTFVQGRVKWVIQEMY